MVAHVTMPARLTPEQFGAEMAVAAGDFTVLSNTVAARDASLPPADLVNALRSPLLREWQPPGGGAVAALSHAVIHSLDVTVALDRPVVAPKEAVIAVLDQLIAANGEWFGIDLTGVRFEAVDADWSGGSGDLVLLNGVVVIKIMATLNATFEAANEETSPGTVAPATPFRSGGPGSLVTWNSLGHDGRNFVTDGPTVD